MKTITVKGIGSVSAKPDLIVISMTLESIDMSYEKSMAIAAEKINDLNCCLEKIGFDKSAVKTTSFNIDMRYENEKDNNGSYIRKFKGYVCSHSLKIEFDFDTKRLAETLQTISLSTAKPELNISFTVKDTNAVNEELLYSASINARKKAEILCRSSSVKLGALVSIDYNFGEINLLSNTRYSMNKECMAAPLMKTSMALDFTPDDINVKDTVTFIWEIDI